MSPDGSDQHQLTTGPGDKTDASFSPDGGDIVYSSNERGDSANLFVIATAGGDPTRLTDYSGYDGAPSWTASAEAGGNGLIAFESGAGDPDGSAGTALWVIAAPRR